MSKKDKKKEKPAGTKPAVNAPCHIGNFTLLKDPSGGTLYIGGWSKNAKFDENTAVIDLTGNHDPDLLMTVLGTTGIFNTFVKKFAKPYYDWLKLPFKDYAKPFLFKEEWKPLADTVKKILAGGHNVLIACQGGHGRTGTTAAILGYYLIGGKDWQEPVKHLRKIYCHEAVDTAEQEAYVYEMLGLKCEVDKKHYIKESPIIYTPPTGNGIHLFGGEGSSWWNHHDEPQKAKKVYNSDGWTTCPTCNTLQKGKEIVDYGMCNECVTKFEKVLQDLAIETKRDIHELKVVSKTTQKCPCGFPNCNGIFMGTCGHVVHDQGGAFKSDCDMCYFDKQAKKNALKNTGQSAAPTM